MESAIMVIVATIIFIGYKLWEAFKVDNYPTNRVNTKKMLEDKTFNNLSDKQVQRNMINGKYDKR